MKITDIRVFPTRSEKVLAFASVTFNGVLVCKGFRVMPGKNGLWVAVPSEKGKDGKYQDTVFPITKEFREELQKAILYKYGTLDNQLHDAGHTTEQPPADEEAPF